jgi:hypothetical protein
MDHLGIFRTAQWSMQKGHMFITSAEQEVPNMPALGKTKAL